jgi:hypothetical protein
MTIVKHLFLLFFIYTSIRLIDSEIFPFFIPADQIFLKCSDGKFESFNSTTTIHSNCVQITQLERFNLFQLYIQCPDGYLYLEYNRTFTFNDQVPEYSMANLQPHCFIDHTNQYQSQNKLVPYQTRYTSENDTFTQIISFQCQHNLTMMLNESSELTEEFYLFFKLMNYSLCRYLIQFMYSNEKCNQFQQEIYKIQALIKNSTCYYQLGIHPSEISLEYFDQLTFTNLSSSKYSPHSTKPVHRTIIIFTVSITAVSLFLCLALLIIMYQFGLFQH